MFELKICTQCKSRIVLNLERLKWNATTKEYEIKNDVFASIIDKESVQDAMVVSSVTKAVLKEYKLMNPDLKTMDVYLRSDNGEKNLTFKIMDFDLSLLF